MNLNNLYIDNVHPLSSTVVYDALSGEVILNIDRVTIALSLEEFGFLVDDLKKASLTINNILLAGVQETNKKDQEIN